MLGKLIKHEFKATTRLLLPIYLVLIALAMICKLVHSLDIFKGILSLIPGTIKIVYIISIFASLLITVVLTVMRFYKNLVSDEGYLMFTLPVKASGLISSKLLVSVCWLLINAALVYLTYLFVFPGKTKQIIESLLSIIELEFGSRSTFLITEFAIVMLISIVDTILLFYVSIAIGQLFYRHKIAFSAAAYIGVYTIYQFIAAIILLIVSLFSNDFIFSITALSRIIFPFFIFFYLALAVALYTATNYIFSKRLNLE
ncbi:MAG: hypothetical protein GX757_08925 [Clostridiales bacterium]|nr:hypothetical protein [Clostridiales bacterium]